MQTSHQPDIKNIEVVVGMPNHQRPPRRRQGEKILMRDWEYPAIRQMYHERHKWLRSVIFPERFNRHCNSYSIRGRYSQTAWFSGKIATGERIVALRDLPLAEPAQNPVQVAIRPDPRGKK
jgi:hypothetical protein